MFKRIVKQVVVWLLILSVVLVFVIKRPAFTSKNDVLVKKVVSVDNLLQHVKQLSHEIKGRSFQSVGLDDASQYIESQFNLYHDRVSVQPYDVNGISVRNVIATHGPDNAAIIVVGAHYDTYDDLPGADDNASGVAGLLELNRMLVDATKAGLTLNKQIILVAYTLEEPPIYASGGMGSVIHAKSLDKEQVVLMISLEMIGYFTDDADSQSYPVSALGLLYPSSGHFITVVDEVFSSAGPAMKKTFIQQGLIEAYSINAPTFIPGIDFSDHRSYWSLGIPAVMITDTAFYRNQNYHTDADTFEKLDYVKMSHVVSGVFAHLKLLATN